ncbi:PAC2 family protein [Actinomyces sp. B33]|uniref:PAC2 family protein n=1 Tax=Actinomyces sp. B33 TaxID=2942131 RepID=UPI0023406511|nr:PAC2 family protein [Actinomyces sp. B33]MDC4233070.1 PAC2 family protein [Actinomyces sp. B33]
MVRDLDEALYERGEAFGARAKILVIHFDGAMDAGGAGRMAVSQMLRSLQVERVATFDSDLLIDYRSHRPLAVVENWVTTGLAAPIVALDLVHDDLGRPILVLHGPEPDARWESFAACVAGIAERAGVEISFAFHGIPSGVPHTRPVPVHVQTTDASLLPDQPQMANVMQFPAPMTSFLQYRLAERGVGGMNLLGAVPYYMADTPYPSASSALLRSLSEFADLTLPVGDLEQGAAQDQGTIEQLIEANPDIMHTVTMLEQHYDMWTGEGGAIPLNGLGQRAGVSQAAKTPKDIGDVIEAYLANVSRLQEGQDEESSPAAVGGDEDAPDTLEDALRRVEERRRHPGARTGAAPRHRAPASPEPEGRSRPSADSERDDADPDGARRNGDG